MADVVDITYDPAKSHVAEDALTAFVQHADIMDLETVPGIGAVHAKTLRESKIPDTLKIDTGYALVGIYLALAEPNTTQQSHCDRFVKFLHHHGVKGNLHTICSAVANRVAIAFPAIYDKSYWDIQRKGKAHAAHSPAVPGA